MTADSSKVMKERTRPTATTTAVTIAEKKYVAGEQCEMRSTTAVGVHPSPLYKATKVSVSESLVAPLISKFEDLTKNGKSSSPSSSSPSPEGTPIRIIDCCPIGPKRSASTSHLAEIGDVTPQQRTTSSSIQCNKDSSMRNGTPERPSKPAVQPKPESLLQRLSIERKQKLVEQLEQSLGLEEDKESSVACKNTNTKSSNGDTEKLYHAPKISSKIMDQNLLMLKGKRLSIAKDCSNLESVLNNDPETLKLTQADGEEVATCDNNENERANTSTTPPVPESKISNNSFLHKYLSEQCSLESHISASKSIADAEESKPECDQHQLSPAKITPEGVPEETVPFKTTKNSSTLHDLAAKMLMNGGGGGGGGGDGGGAMTAGCWIQPTGDGDGDGDGDHRQDLGYNHHPHRARVAESSVVDYYQCMDGDDDVDSEGSGSTNVYSDVIYAQLSNRDDAENYETISWESLRDNCSTGTKNRFSLSNDNLEHSGSESSLEKTNSLYDLKPPSESSSTMTANAFNVYFRGKLEALHLHTPDLRNATRSITDEEDTDYCDTDNDCLTNRSVSNKSKNFKKKRKLKFPIYRKEYPPMIEDCETNESFIDDFDDSSSDLESFEMNGHQEQPPVRQIGHNKSSISSLAQSQNIYGLVEKARKTVRKSWSSLNQIRKMSVSNITARHQDSSQTRNKSASVGEFNFKNTQSTGNGGSVRWTSFKSRLKPKYSTVSPTTSIFYLPPEDLVFDKSHESGVTKRPNCSSKNRRRTTCIELRPTARPTSPPPPPPIDKSKMNGTNSVSSLSIYSDPSTRSSNSGSEINSEPHSSRSSDLHLRFTDEPLYQFYAQSIAQLNTGDSLNVLNDTDGYEEIASTTSRPSAMELITPSPNGHGQHRSLWCEVLEVRNSGILETLSPDKKRLQEAIFEIITSEASYYKSLSVLDKIFANSPSFRNESVLSKNDWKILFGNVTEVRKCSEKLLAALEQCWQDSILLTGLCHVIYEHARDHFQIYVKYCSNQIYIDRTLKKLKEQNFKFVEIIHQLEANPACQSLNLPSFLMLPMQRITRMPLLIDAVLSKMDPIIDGDEYETYQITLATLNKIVRDCNESARKLERYEEMLLLSQQLEFTRKEVKMYTIASSSRWLIRSGPMEHIPQDSSKLTLTKKLTKQTTKLYFFLFNDILIVAKKKNDAPTYVVLDYCARNVVQMSLLDDSGEALPALNSSNHRYLLMLTILDNHEGKTVVMILNCDSDSTRQRWLETTSSHLTSDNPDEKLYEKWDCPQVSAIHSYTAVQPDELSLHAGDVVKVLKKTTDGWYHGERIRDGMTGWFPGNFTVEIASQHTRAKNLKLRHRLLTLSASYLQHQQQKKT